MGRAIGLDRGVERLVMRSKEIAEIATHRGPEPLGAFFIEQFGV